MIKFTNPFQEEFIAATTAEMEAKGVRIRLQDQEQIDCDGFPVSGYFDEDEPAFAVAMGGTNTQLVMSVYVHEYSHFRQWVEDAPAWNAKLQKNVCPQGVFDAWLAHAVELIPEQNDAALKLLVALERDCEERALAVVMENPRLDIDPTWYIRSANLYLMYYGVVKRTRRWYDKPMHAQPLLLSLVPSDRLVTVEEALNPPSDLHRAICETCYLPPL